MRMGTLGDTWEDQAKYHFFIQDYPIAEYFYKHLCKVDPTWDSWYFRGLSFKYQEMYESALYCFDQALGLGVRMGDVLYQIGSIFTKLKKFGKAIHFLSLAQQYQISGNRPLLLKCWIYLIQNELEEYQKHFYKISSDGG